MSILVTGSTAYDLLLTYDGRFAEGINWQKPEHFNLACVTPHFSKLLGGTAANIAQGLKTLGADPLIVSTVGKDGEEAVAALTDRGIHPAHLEQLPDHYTATAIITTDTDERQVVFFHPGADAHGTWPDLSAKQHDIAYAVVSPRDRVLMMEALAWCEEHKVPSLFDPGQQLFGFSSDELRRCIQHCTGVIGNEAEWDMLSEKLGSKPAKLIGDVDYAIVTKGENGVQIYSKEEVWSVPACKVDDVVNPTGAGDAFRAGFLLSLTRGDGFESAAQLGCAVASFVVEQESPQLTTLDLGQLEERMENAYGL